MILMGFVNVRHVERACTTSQGLVSDSRPCEKLADSAVVWYFYIGSLNVEYVLRLLTPDYITPGD